MIGWADLTDATAAERAKRALAGVLGRRSRLGLGLVLGSMAGFVLRHAKNPTTPSILYPQSEVVITVNRVAASRYAEFVRPLQNFTSVDVTSNMASTETCILTPKLHFYLVPTHSYNYFRFRVRHVDLW